MMEARDRVFLLDMRDAAERVRTYLGDRSRADLDTDPMLLDAVVRQLEILGEAARSVSPAGRQLLPEVPWRAIVGMRNQLVHAYKAVDREAVWRTATDDIPVLLQRLRSALEGS
jgi:uncharacterized protein with HEPN domain